MNKVSLPIITAFALTLAGCVSNPFQPMPGGTEFKMSADGTIHYANTGRDVDSASGDVTFPNGARGKFRVSGSRGSAATNEAVGQQAAINMALIAAMPKLTAADLMKLLPLLVGAPPVPVP